MRGRTRAGAAVLVWLLGCLGRPAPIDAHRLDEYLQAARLDVDLDRVGIELDLTPGVAIAPAVLAMIDRDRDGEISDAEGEDYARQVIEALVMDVDGRPVRARLDDRAMPAWRDVAAGTGVIRLRASADLPRVGSGRHQLFFRNVHRSEIGVYLVNALVPSDDRIEITGQRRDGLQHEVTIDFRVRGAARRVGMAWSALAAFLVAATIGLVSVRRRPAARP
jgi:hypothetical protein